MNLNLMSYTLDGQKISHPCATPKQNTVALKEEMLITGRQDYLLWEMGQRAIVAGTAFCGQEGNS